MSLLPDEIAGQTFERRRRGYDTGQVGAFLQRVAADYTAAIHRIGAIADDQSGFRRSREELSATLADAARQARQSAEQARREADDDARAIRERAEQAAALITRHAEETAAALTAQAGRLRDAARQDADAARAVVTEARQHAAEVEDSTRKRCEALRAEAAERTLTDQLRAIEHATAALRSRAGVLDQVDQLEELIGMVRAGLHPAGRTRTASPGG